MESRGRSIAKSAPHNAGECAGSSAPRTSTWCGSDRSPACEHQRPGPFPRERGPDAKSSAGVPRGLLLYRGRRGAKLLVDSRRRQHVPFSRIKPGTSRLPYEKVGSHRLTDGMNLDFRPKLLAVHQHIPFSPPIARRALDYALLDGLQGKEAAQAGRASKPMSFNHHHRVHQYSVALLHAG